MKSSVVKKCAVYSHHHNTGKFCDSDVKCKSLNIVSVCGVVCEFVIKLYVGETGDIWYQRHLLNFFLFCRKQMI